MTSKLTRDRLAEIAQFGFSSAITPANDFEIKELARMALAAMDSEPVIVVGDDGGDALSYRRLIQSFEPGTKLYRHAQPVPEKYNIGDATMRHIFTPTGMTDVSDMQAVFDRVEAVLVGMEQPAPVVPEKCPAEIRDLISSHTDALFNDDDAQEIWNACLSAMLNGDKP